MPSWHFGVTLLVDLAHGGTLAYVPNNIHFTTLKDGEVLYGESIDVLRRA